jgi:predicted AlkP superfamily pyrophosphatase or phosphodiesterase
LVAAGILRDATDETLKEESGAGRDLLWTEAACHVIRRRKPNLLLLHLLNVDYIHHSYGAQSPPGYTAVAYADTCVGKVLAALDEAGIRRQTTVFVVADHGFTATPQALKPNVLLRQEGLLTTGRGGRIETARAHVFPEGGIGLLYLTDSSSREEDRKRVRTLFAGKEGIERILEPAEYAEFGLPDPRANPQMSDLVLVAKDGYGFSASGEGDELVVANTAAGVTLGSHGFISTSAKMNALFVAAGQCIKPGVKLGLIDNTEVAPTAAKILGVKLRGAEGQALDGILTP